MAKTAQSVVPLILACTGNTAITSMTQVNGGAVFRKSGIEAGGRIVLGTATAATVLVKDGTGRVLYNAAVTASTDIPAGPAGVTGPITVTATSVSNSTTGTFTVYWWVKK